MNYSDITVWTIILVLGVGTFLIRFSFLGLIGERKLPDWVLRHLRYTPVAVIPGLIAPLVAWPDATGGSPDPARMIAAAVTALVGYLTRNVLAAVLSGMASLYAGLALIG
ncbi:AzlD domain-containing protein [Tropicimonas marinistellae]|uniref:AzlD domain-containing protein n=1 Tax=Tropicimonas marinistellae TaxID=1739787 RepID=UPI000835C5E4|nr:AzlD domain-containing protein [Tropicimonas marinistellae]